MPKRVPLRVALEKRLTELRRERGMSRRDARPYDQYARTQCSHLMDVDSTITEIVEYCAWAWVGEWTWKTQP